MSLYRFFYDPFDEFDNVFEGDTRSPALRRRGGEHSNAAPRPWAPKMDIKEVADNQLMATIELPGLKKENVNIDVHNDRLTISGETETSSETKHDNGGYTVRERSYGKFTRALPLPRGTKPEDVKANMENGVLTLTYPKNAAENTPARITIN